MREEWNKRARVDARFYVAFGRRNQTDEDFQASAAENISAFEREFFRLPDKPVSARRALEVGCGLGRLMLPMSRHFGEIHGVDVSDQMVSQARIRLQAIHHAYVHVTSGSDLRIFDNSYFDYIYSYIVFQHIPDKDIVLNYLLESKRVLKPGGVLCCQLRGCSPIPSELSRESETWTGCFFSSGEIAEFARRNEFPLVAIAGINTQYMWTTFRKSQTDIKQAGGRCVIDAITAASGTAPTVPSRGRDAAVSLWIRGMPHDSNLADCSIVFGKTEQLGCYLSPISGDGGCQLNARLPDGLDPGEYVVSMFLKREQIEGAHKLVVTAPASYDPHIAAMTDGINLTSKFRVETGGAKVIIEDLADPHGVSFAVAGRPGEYLQYECKDPITSTYEFAFHLQQKTPKGRQELRITIGDKELPPIEIDVC